MTHAPDRLRIDVWLWRARFAKTRAAAQALIAEGGVRLSRAGALRRIDKPSAEIAVLDEILLPLRGQLRSLRVLSLGFRRGPPAEARALYEDISAPSNADLAGLA